MTDRISRIAGRVADGDFLRGEVVKDADGYAEVSFKVKGDALESLLRLLRHCERCGNMGHSFEIVADPKNSEYRGVFGFDGDGADRIRDISVQGVPLPKSYGGNGNERHGGDVCSRDAR